MEQMNIRLHFCICQIFYLKAGLRHNKIFHLFDSSKFNNMVQPIRTWLRSDIPNCFYVYRWKMANWIKMQFFKLWRKVSIPQEWRWMKNISGMWFRIASQTVSIYVKSEVQF